MTTITTVHAEHFERSLSGRNRAVLLGCAGPSGEQVTAVVKLWHRLEQKENSYWVEWVAGILAAKLGVNVPPRLVVQVSPEMAQVLTEALEEDAKTSARPTFGTEYVSPVVPVTGDGGALEEDLREAGAEIAAFDVFVDNIDRRLKNPNLLIDARPPRRMLAFDHDLAFSSFLVPVFSSNWPLDILRDHVLAGRFGSKKPDLQRIRAAIQGLTDVDLDALVAETPPIWLAGSASTRLNTVIAKLKERRNSIDT